jgi:hypothetical protein
VTADDGGTAAPTRAAVNALLADGKLVERKARGRGKGKRLCFRSLRTGGRFTLGLRGEILADTLKEPIHCIATAAIQLRVAVGAHLQLLLLPVPYLGKATRDGERGQPFELYVGILDQDRGLSEKCEVR